MLALRRYRLRPKLKQKELKNFVPNSLGMLLFAHSYEFHSFDLVTHCTCSCGGSSGRGQLLLVMMSCGGGSCGRVGVVPTFHRTSTGGGGSRSGC